MTEDHKPKSKLTLNKLTLSKPVDVTGLRQAYLDAKASKTTNITEHKITGLKIPHTSSLTEEEVHQSLELIKKAEQQREQNLAKTVKEPITPVIEDSEKAIEVEVPVVDLPEVIEEQDTPQNQVPQPETIETTATPLLDILPDNLLAQVLDAESLELEEKALAKPEKNRRENSKKLRDFNEEILNLEEPLNDDAPEAPVIPKRKKEHRKPFAKLQQKKAKIARTITIPETIGVHTLANLMAEKIGNVIRELQKLGITNAAKDQVIDADTAELLANAFGHQIKVAKVHDVASILQMQQDAAKDLAMRPPVVTVMGHVDHGKTSLLDALRTTSIALREAGGITQHIGAYSVVLPHNRSITFIDTPGHEAFTAMRSRGAKITDIVVLVVAADEGIKPQTIEAINHAKAAQVPIIVAINKIDRPGANIEKIKHELLQYNLISEDLGGDIIMVPISALKKIGLDVLEEAILMLAEMLDLKANYKVEASGIVIEAKVDKNRGIVATLLVQRGTLAVGDILVAGSAYGRVRAINDSQGEKLKEATPAMPVEILGWAALPNIGEKFTVVKSDKEARDLAKAYEEKLLTQKIEHKKPVNLEEAFMSSLNADAVNKCSLVIKADTQGSLEAITAMLNKIEHPEIQLQLLHTGIGNVSDSDVALANASKASIIGFNVKAMPSAITAAKNAQIEIKYYSIIYNLLDDIKASLSGLLPAILQEEYLGTAEVRQIFDLTKSGIIAGSYVTKGVIKRGAHVKLKRNEENIYEGKISTLKRFKEDVKEVKEGFECGIQLENYEDIKVGDTIEAYTITKKSQYIS